MQIKNILLAALFFATSQLSCVDEQTNIKAKLCAELDAKCEILSNLSKKIIEQEATCEASKVKLFELLKKYDAWQKNKLTENNIEYHISEQELSTIKQRIIKNGENFGLKICEALKNNHSIQNIIFDEEYKQAHEEDHELFTFYITRTAHEAGMLKYIINKWKACASEVANLEKQINKI